MITFEGLNRENLFSGATCIVQRTATDDPVACLSVTRLCCAQTAERIEVLFGTETPGDPRYSVLDGGSDPPSVRESGGK